MKFILLFFLCLSYQFSHAFYPTFEEKQLKYQTVLEAKAMADSALKKEFESKGLVYPPNNMLMQVFKAEATLEIWVQNAAGEQYQLFKSYDICGMSGTLGPKRKRGDEQVPEGFYKFSFFNPESSYFLSMKVDYPNASDSVLGKAGDLGDNIFMHGSCCSLGCMAITDDYIAEVYWLAVQVVSNTKSELPIYIYPTRMTDYKTKMLKTVYGDTDSKFSFWANMKEGYQKFLQTRQKLNYTVDEGGKYVFH